MWVARSASDCRRGHCRPTDAASDDEGAFAWEVALSSVLLLLWLHGFRVYDARGTVSPPIDGGHGAVGSGRNTGCSTLERRAAVCVFE